MAHESGTEMRIEAAPDGDPVACNLYSRTIAAPQVVLGAGLAAKCIAKQFPGIALSMSPIARPSENSFSPTGNWTREQTLLAFQFYCETPFGQLHRQNRKIVELAQLIGRTPSALAMKCVNLASLDPKIRASGRAGLSNASALDRSIWEEAHADWGAVIAECESLLAYLRKEKQLPEPKPIPDEETDYTGEVRTALVKQRIGQDFFRRSVLSSYGERCCISGVSDKHFLVASHIVPWNEDATIRLHPGNGLCLSTIHDRAFDKHLFSLTDDHRVILSERLKNAKDDFLRQVFWPTEGRQIALPEKFVPETSFIARHRERMTTSGSTP